MPGDRGEIGPRVSNIYERKQIFENIVLAFPILIISDGRVSEVFVVEEVPKDYQARKVIPVNQDLRDRQENLDHQV